MRQVNSQDRRTSVTQQFEIPSSIVCTFDVSGEKAFRARACRLPATQVLTSRTYYTTLDRPVSYQGRCKRHAGVDKRRTYSVGTIEDFTQEIIDQMVKEIEETKAAQAERQAQKNAEHEKSVAAQKVHRAEEAKRLFAVTRDDERGEADWDAYRAAVKEEGESPMVYGPDVPRWYIRPANEERSFNEGTVKVNRRDGYPVTIEVRHSSEIDINEALALVEALRLAIEEAQHA
jgi:hypothetical protein